jgi:hypothetical protein
MGKLLYLWKRLQEPSSHIAIAFLLATFKVDQVSYDNWQNVAALVMTIIAVFVPEGKPETQI